MSSPLTLAGEAMEEYGVALFDQWCTTPMHVIDDKSNRRERIPPILVRVERGWTQPMSRAGMMSEREYCWIALALEMDFGLIGGGYPHPQPARTSGCLIVSPATFPLYGTMMSRLVDYIVLNIMNHDHEPHEHPIVVRVLLKLDSYLSSFPFRSSGTYHQFSFRPQCCSVSTTFKIHQRVK